jgi:DNA-binding transcriptional LysR family regulator
LEVKDLFAEELRLASPPGHSLARKQTVRLADLEKEPFIVILAEGLKDHLRRALRRVRREKRGGGEQGLQGSACQWRQG